MAEEEEERGGGLCWCLRRVGERPERLLLPEGEEVTMGRGVGVTYQLVSMACPLMISRTHCVFRQDAASQWTVTDNNSLNGVWVNRQRLEPQKPHPLTKGCSVQLGVPLPNQDQPEFDYEFVQENLEQIRPFLTRPAAGKSKPPRNKRKLNHEESEASGTEGTSNSSKAKVQRVAKEGKLPSKSVRVVLTKLPTVKVESERPDQDSQTDSQAMAATQQQQQQHCPDTLRLSNMRQSMAELRSLNSQVLEKQAAVQEKISRPQESTSKDSKCLQSAQQELQHLQQQLHSKREEHLQRVTELKKTFQEERHTKGSHSRVSKSAEEDLKEKMSEVLQEHSLLMEELNQSHRDFELIIQAQNRELQETKKEKERMEAQREEVLNHMNDVLDNELQCIICSEHFIEAVTLNCAHSFCSFCIQSWRKRKEECPICRQEIKSQTRSLVLDNCIDRMVAKLSPEMKDRRLCLILERKDRQQEVTAAPISIDSDSDSDRSFNSADFYAMPDSDDLDHIYHDLESEDEEDDDQEEEDDEADDYEDDDIRLIGNSDDDSLDSLEDGDDYAYI